MAEVLKFDTGLVEYEVNGGTKISFNPTDTALLKRVIGVFSDLTDLQDHYAALGEQDPGALDLEGALEDQEKARSLQQRTTAMLDAFAQMDRDMREKIDSIFGVGTADGVFGALHLYAFADGLPVWANFLLAILDKFPDAAEAQAERTDPRLKKYAGRWSGKYKRGK